MSTKARRRDMVAVQRNEEIVNRYFQLISAKDVEGLVDLFTDDAVIYEPFSKEPNGLRGKTAIGSFFKVAVMANAGLNRTIKFVDSKDEDSITALVTFERGDKIQGRFTFYLTDDCKWIRMLKIQFNKS